MIAWKTNINNDIIQCEVVISIIHATILAKTSQLNLHFILRLNDVPVEGRVQGNQDDLDGGGGVNTWLTSLKEISETYVK